MISLVIAELSSVGAGIGIAGAIMGVGLIVIGAAFGLGKIVTGMADGMARQPEVANSIRGTSMLLGFLLEGVALFACVIAFLATNSLS